MNPMLATSNITNNSMIPQISLGEASASLPVPPNPCSSFVRSCVPKVCSGENGLSETSKK